MADKNKKNKEILVARAMEMLSNALRGDESYKPVGPGGSYNELLSSANYNPYRYYMAATKEPWAPLTEGNVGLGPSEAIAYYTAEKNKKKARDLYAAQLENISQELQKKTGLKTASQTLKEFKDASEYQVTKLSNLLKELWGELKNE